MSPLCLFRNSGSAKNMKMEEISENISNELNSILEWLNSCINKLSLSVKKTKFMLFHYHQCNVNSLIPKLALNSEPIERVTECNFLGLTIDGHLSWTPHIQKISNKKSLVPSELDLQNYVWTEVSANSYTEAHLHLIFCRLQKSQKKRAIRTIAKVNIMLKHTLSLEG